MKQTKLLKSILIPTLGVSAIGTIATISASCSNGSENENKQHQYVGITANANSTLTLANTFGNNPDLQYSTDGTNWTTYSTTININQGQTLYLKGNNPTGWSSNLGYSSLSTIGDVSISGNVMGLLDNGAKSGEEGDITDIPYGYCFYGLFRNSTGITSVSEDFLPATNLKQNCYDGMFYNCSSLTTVPKLPSMSLRASCYKNMFKECTSLTTAPELPARTLAESCYDSMFYSCSSLTTAPDLPSTTLSNYCYQSMFDGCTSLTTAPELPATALSDNCYGWMFEGCSSLNSIKIHYTFPYSNAYLPYWVNGVADSGTFYYNGGQTAQDFQFPEGWIKQPF